MWIFRRKRPEPKEECPPVIKQWRDINWGNNQDDLQYVRNYTPQSEDQQLRILLHGPPGAGKSSFINSVQSVLRGRIYRQALADNIAHDCFTKEYTTFKIPKEPKTFYPFIFTDTMGLRTQGGVKEEDINLALKGRIKEGYQFNPETHLQENKESYIEKPELNDKVHVLVCVIPANTLSIIDKDILKMIRKIRQEASTLKIPQLALLTKIDVAHPEIKEDMKSVYKLQSVKEQMEMLSADVGFPMNCIFPVKNYHEEIDMNEDINSLILSVMKHIINSADDYINFIQPEPESS